MAIRCSGCGREYDVSLFQFGRTIHCTCGRRVGLESRLEVPRKGGEPRFILDGMLGGLARWLRILGFDTAFEPEAPDGELVRRAITEGRHLVTMDRQLPVEWRVADCFVLRTSDPDRQLQEVLARFRLRDRIRLFSRCPVCNIPLRAAAPEEVRERLPPRVYELHSDFSACDACGRVYWEGSHTRRILTRLQRVLRE